MSSLLGALIPAAYVSGWILAARQLFARWRPSSEPIYCRQPWCDIGKWGGTGTHHRDCYTRGDMSPDSNGEAAAFASLAGLLWPVLWVPWLVMVRPHPLEGELKAKIDRLEKELKIND